MRTRQIILACCLALALGGCSKEEAPAPAPQPAAQPAPAPAPAPEPAAPVTQNVVEQAQQATQQATDAAQQVAQQATDTAQQAVDQAKTAAGGLVAQAQQTVQDALGSGQAVYEKACRSCHNSGLMKAPKLGDKEAWKVLNENGEASLVSAAINGVGKMPARGGHKSLTDDEVRAAVVYMMEQGK